VQQDKGERKNEKEETRIQEPGDRRRTKCLKGTEVPEMPKVGESGTEETRARQENAVG
jgi:hypothetical protein